jgi:hypothetical protein
MDVVLFDSKSSHNNLMHVMFLLLSLDRICTQHEGIVGSLSQVLQLYRGSIGTSERCHVGCDAVGICLGFIWTLISASFALFTLSCYTNQGYYSKREFIYLKLP